MSRYQVVTRDDETFLQCSTAANLRVHVQYGLSVDKGKRKSYSSQTIFLDGAYTGAPFMDNKERQYSLDHHADCVRGFTLATCEQAVVMLLQGLPLAEGNWRIYLSDPDLDAIFAAWILLNHTEMCNADRELMRAAMPLIRLEGVIDAHGLEYGPLLSALPDEVLLASKSKLDELYAIEREQKQSGKWTAEELPEYTRAMLDRLDNHFLTDTYLSELQAVEEVSSVAVEGNRVALLCRSKQGIYEVESALKERYGRQLALIVLEVADGRYTIRQVDNFLHNSLVRVYKVLNRTDPRANPEDGNLWGGSADIGGSPRGTGTGLSGDEILAAIAEVYQHRNWFQRLTHWLWSSLKGES